MGPFWGLQDDTPDHGDRDPWFRGFGVITGQIMLKGEMRGVHVSAYVQYVPICTYDMYTCIICGDNVHT